MYIQNDIARYFRARAGCRRANAAEYRRNDRNATRATALEIEPLRFRPEDWTGDPDELSNEVVEALARDFDLCELTFATKNEAFTVGLEIGRREAKRNIKEPQADQGVLA